MKLARAAMCLAALTVTVAGRAAPQPAQASSADCNASAAAPSVTIQLPSSPFTAVPSHDGCWVFVSLTGGPGIAVLKRGGGVIQLSKVTPLASGPTGIVLTHDGKLLIAAAGSSVIFLDVQRLTSPAADVDPVVGSLNDGGSGLIYVNVSADDQLLFVSDEGSETITVIDLARARANGYKADAIKGKIPTGLAPIALTFSRDGKSLYTTSELAAPAWGWPAACKPEGSPDGTPIRNPEGAIVVVDVARAATDPANSVVAKIPAGCSAVRMAMSPSGDRIYVTARNSNAVLAFDTAKLLTDADHARVGMAPVGSAPVPVAVIDGGRKVVSGNSNRFAGGSSGESLNVLDAAKMVGTADAGLGEIAAGAFPRELRVSEDGHTLFLTNFGSSSLQVISVDRILDAPRRR